MFDPNLMGVKKNDKKEFIQSIVSFEDDEEDLESLNRNVGLTPKKPSSENLTLTPNNYYSPEDKNKPASEYSNINNLKGKNNNEQNNYNYYGESKITSPGQDANDALEGSQLGNAGQKVIKNGISQVDDYMKNGSQYKNLQGSPEPLLNNGKTPEYVTKDGGSRGQEVVKRVNFEMSSQKSKSFTPDAKLSDIQIHRKTNRLFFYMAIPSQHQSQFLELPPFGKRLIFFLNILQK